MKTIHLINPLEDPFGGSENRVLEIYRLLRNQAKISVWSQEGLHADLKEKLNAKLIDPKRLALPLWGDFVFVGTYYHFGNWLRLTRPQRICLIHNTPEVEKLHRAIDRLSAMGLGGNLRIAYASKWLHDAAGLPGDVLPSPINLDRFRPATSPPNNGTVLTIGRLSRDVEDKHHPEDPLLYRHWADQGHLIRVMGGTCLSRVELQHPNIELLPCGAESPEQFLQSLDVFFYRTHPRWREPSGRVVSEAMAAGRTLVCDRHGGYVEEIIEGENGLLFDDSSAAIFAMETVSSRPDLRHQLGAAARAHAIRKYSDNSMQAVVSWLLSQP